MEITCGNCSKSSPYRDFNTNASNILECPKCNIRFSIRPSSDITEYGAEIYSKEVQILDSVPTIIKEAGQQSQFAWEEFFSSIPNQNTKRAYKRIVKDFLDFVSTKNLILSQISPKICREYFDNSNLALSSKKQSLSALRHFFDYQVTRHAVLLNPVSSIRLERMEYSKGKTIPFSAEEVERIFTSNELKNPIDLRDRVILGMLAYTGCRIASLSTLNCEDFILNEQGTRVLLKEKNGKINEIPVRSNLLFWIKEYQGFSDIHSGPLLRGFIGIDFIKKEKCLTLSAIQKVVQKRIKAAGLSNRSAHSFRAGVATSLLEKGTAQEEVQKLLGHSDPRTTQLYDHSNKTIPQNLVETI